MERYALLTDQQNLSREADYTAKKNLQIKCNPHQNATKNT